MTCTAAIQNAPSWPEWTGIHQSACFEVVLMSGESTTSFAPSCRASDSRCALGVRVTSGFDPIATTYFEWYQSALSATSVCSPQVWGEAFGRSQYQS